MKWYIISYDLNSPGKEYSKLFEKIRSIANGYCKILRSVWIIGHKGNAKAIHGELAAMVDANDHIFVSEITNDYWWSLPQDIGDWFNKNVRF